VREKRGEKGKRKELRVKDRREQKDEERKQRERKN
jgi:hypothetical protein